MVKKKVRVHWLCSNGHEHTDKELAILCEGRKPHKIGTQQWERDLKALELYSQRIHPREIGEMLGYKGAGCGHRARWHWNNGKRVCSIREPTDYFLAICKALVDSFEVRV